MRVPGFRSRIFGRSFMLMSGSRNIVMTVAFEKSVSKRSAFMNVALSVTPSLAAFFFDSSTMSGLYSMPIARRAALGGGDHRAAVARAEVHQEVLRRDLGHVEHLVDQRLRRRHPDDVLAGLADLGFELLRRFLCGCRLRVRADGQQANPKGQPGPPDHTSCIHKTTPDKANVGDFNASSVRTPLLCCPRLEDRSG